MKENLSRMLRSGLAMLVALCLVAGLIPTAAFAAGTEINYVSLGDSMTNGYCFTGYDQGNISAADFLAGDGVYGNDAYPNLFATWLAAETGMTVNHSKLAVSAMRAEDLNYLLGGREMPTDGWFDQVEHYSGTSGDALKGIYQDAVADADVITMSIGNAAFGAYLVQYVTRSMGVLGGSLPEEEKVDLQKALEVLDAEKKAIIMEAYNEMMAVAAGYAPEALGPINVQDMVDLMAYVGAGFLLNYEGVLDQIVELNPDVEIVLVGLMNTTYGMEVTAAGMDPIAIGDIMDALFGALNAYIAAVPATYQAAGKWEDAKFYYADMPNPEFIVQVYDDMYYAGWPADYYGLSGATVRARTIKAYNEALRPMLQTALGMNLPAIDLDDVQNYIPNADYMTGITAAMYTKWMSEAYTPNYIAEKQISIAIYLALEESLAASVDSMEITLEGLMGIAGNPLNALGPIPEALKPENSPSPIVIKTALVNWFTGSATGLAMCKVFAMFKVGDGMSVHPTPAAHADIADAVIAAYGNYTAKDETVKNVEILLDELYALVETYGPEAAAQVWAQWVEYGYVDAVETSISELKAMLTARYTYYTENALPAIETSIAQLAAQQDALSAELAALKAELEAKKAELEAAINGIEIGAITVPEVNIDVELGNNEQTLIPENNCTVNGESVEAELEAAIKDLEHAIATIEALIADIEADIADMIALAEQIAAAVAELEKTMAEVEAAVADLETAIETIIAIITDTDAIVAQQVSAFEAARDTAAAAVNVLSLTIGTAETMMADVDAMIEKICADADALYEKFVTDLPACIEQIPTEAIMLVGGSAMLLEKAYELNKAEIDAALEAELAKLAAEYEANKQAALAELAALAAEYNISEEAILAELAKLELEYANAEAALKAELAAIEAQIAEEVAAKYAVVEAEINAQIEAAKAEAAVKLAALNEELKAYEEALIAAATEEAKAAIQPQIDRVLADIATVEADLACAIAHLENAAEIAYEQIVAEITEAYEEAVAAVEQKIAELEAAYNAAVAAVEQKIAELKAAYDAAVAAVEQKIAELEAAYNNAVAAAQAAAEQAIAELKAAVDAKLEELNNALEAVKDALTAQVEGVLDAIHNELAGMQAALEEILQGNLAAVEALKDALAEMGAEAIVEAAEALIEAVMAMIEEATTADLVIDNEFKYVAIGDGSAAAESYVEKLAAALSAEAVANGVDEIEFVNNAYVGNTVTAERENLSDVTDADLITIGFSNVEFLNAALNNAMNGVELDWAAIVGEENVHYVEELLAEVAAEIAASGVTGEYAAMANAVIESYAYSMIQYAVELPQLINEINAINPEALIIIVGMYNPLADAVIALDENTSIDLGEYIDYLVAGVAVHGIAYSIISGNSIYVDAPAVQTVNTDAELSALDLMRMIMNGFADLYPSAVGDDYIAAEICDALNITYVKDILLGDVNLDGIVDQSDVALLFAYVLDTESLIAQQLLNADVNFDGEVDQSDLTKLFSFVLGEIESL